MGLSSDAAMSSSLGQPSATELQEVKRWVPSFDVRRRPQVRLFCFPYAGAGASTFRDWQAGLPPFVQLLPVQLPGRESRWHEPACTNMISLARRLSRSLSDLLNLPYGVFGHSMGGLIAFEFVRQLRKAALPMPNQLFISSTRAPHVPDRELPLHRLPDSLFLAQLTGRFGLPADPRNLELAKALLPVLRADFALCETYHPVPQEPLDVPLRTYGGRSDRMVVYSDLVGWRTYTKRAFTLKTFPGDHFFLHGQRSALLRVLSSDLVGRSSSLQTNY